MIPASSKNASVSRVWLPLWRNQSTTVYANLKDSRALMRLPLRRFKALCRNGSIFSNSAAFHAIFQEASVFSFFKESAKAPRVAPKDWLLIKPFDAHHGSSPGLLRNGRPCVFGPYGFEFWAAQSGFPVDILLYALWTCLFMCGSPAL